MRSAFAVLQELRRKLLQRGAPEQSSELASAGRAQQGQRLDAVLLYSRRFDRKLWIARDEEAALTLQQEFVAVPIFTFDEASYLTGKPDELLRAILDVKAVFMGARLQR